MTDRTLGRHPEDDLLLELALAQLDDQRRDRVTGHLTLCEPCRSRYDVLADAVDHVLVAAPPVQPPAGFSQAVLAATGLDGSAQAGERADVASGRGARRGPGLRPAARGSGPRTRSRATDRPRDVRTEEGMTAAGRTGVRADGHRRRGRGTTLLVAAALVVGIAVGAGGSAVVLHGRDTAAQQVAAGAPLRTSGGGTVGAVQESRSEGQRVLVITVTGGPAAVRYSCWLVLADGSRQPAGAWALDGAGRGSWVVPWPDGGAVTSVEMVADSGARWAVASI